jgi:hypothetical protein
VRRAWLALKRWMISRSSTSMLAQEKLASWSWALRRPEGVPVLFDPSLAMNG